MAPGSEPEALRSTSELTVWELEPEPEPEPEPKVLVRAPESEGAVRALASMAALLSTPVEN